MTAGLMMAITASARLMETTKEVAIMAPTAISTPIIFLLFFMVSPLRIDRDGVSEGCKGDARRGGCRSGCSPRNGSLVTVGGVYAGTPESSTIAQLVVCYGGEISFKTSKAYFELRCERLDSGFENLSAVASLITSALALLA